MCRFWFERSSGIAAILNPFLGYDTTAKLVRESLQKNKSIKNLIIEKGYLSKTKTNKLFSISKLTKPNLSS